MGQSKYNREVRKVFEREGLRVLSFEQTRGNHLAVKAQAPGAKPKTFILPLTPSCRSNFRALTGDIRKYVRRAEVT